MIFLASDHGGYRFKEVVKNYLIHRGVAVEDLGVFSQDAADYPPLARRCARAVLKHKAMGILFCRSGQGMTIAANRFKGIRAALAWNEAVAKEAREDNDANILSLPCDYLSEGQVKTIVSAFFSTSFSQEERHKRRLKQIDGSL